jgi:hypothetical protein
MNTVRLGSAAATVVENGKPLVGDTWSDRESLPAPDSWCNLP